MEMFDSLEKALEKYPDSYVSHSQMANCMICGEHKDLRCGACFSCCEKIDGNPIKSRNGEIVGHKLFEKDNPDNSWITGV